MAVLGIIKSLVFDFPTAFRAMIEHPTADFFSRRIREPEGFDHLTVWLDLLGHDYLDRLLVSSAESISLFDPDVNPLRMWLKSAVVDQHIVQIVEFAAYLRSFKYDPALDDKIAKLKRDRFWPVFFRAGNGSA